MSTADITEIKPSAPVPAAITEQLGDLKQDVDKPKNNPAEIGNKVVELFKNLFNSDKRKEAFAALIGAFIGFWGSVEALGQKSEEEPKTDEERAKLREQIDEEMLLASDIQDIELATEEGAINITGPAFEAVVADRSLSPNEKAVKIEDMLENQGTIVDFNDIRNDPSLTPSDRGRAVADKLKEKGLVAANCFKFVEIVYILSGFKRESIFNSARTYAGKDCGENCAPPEVLDQLEPGDHIFINNRNEADDHGNHSVIFLGWADKSKYLGKVMGYYAKKRSFHEFSVILKGESAEKWAQMSDKEKSKINPVTQIIKPVMA
jgi:anti-sigma regulatory factor (Ser/Thr protein kinase)